jgi:Fe-S cluster assembly protein SufD
MSEHAFLTHLQEQFNRSLKSDAMKTFREKGWQQLTSLGLPAKSHEAYRYVSLKELYASSFDFSCASGVEKSLFAQAILPECKHSHIVFVDGCFSPDLSDIAALPKQAMLLPLDEAQRLQASFLQNHLARSLKEETDPFALINLALHSAGAFFYLPPKIEVTVPIQCIHVITGNKSALPRLYLVLGAESKMRWIVSYHTLQSSAAHLLMPAMEISLEEGASLNLLNIVDAVPMSWHMESVRATLKKNARLQTLCVTTGAKAVRQSYRVQLKGEGSEANLNGLWMLSKNRTSHIHAIVDHEAPHTHSMQLFKGVLNDVSHSSFEGKILVREAAQKTEAYQLNNNLILSQGAIANSKPNLEVFADDVKASHGATMSQLDEEQLFYLSTRGIAEPEARRLLIGGFCREMIEQIPYPSVLQKMQQHIDTFVNSGAS